MKKFLSYIICGMMASLMLMSAIAFSACGENTNDDLDKDAWTVLDKDAWTVVVYKPDGTPYEGASVQLCTVGYDVDGKGTCFFPVMTDAEGKAVCKPDTTAIEEAGIDTTYLVIHLQEGFKQKGEEGKYTYDDKNGVQVKKGSKVEIHLELA